MKDLWTRKCFSVLTLLALASLPVAADDDDDEERQMRARLSGFQEVPAVSTTGRGEFRGTINGQSISFRLTYSDLEGAVNAAHIHFGQSGVNGGVMAFLCGGGGKPACPASGTVAGDISAADILGPADQGIESGNFAEAIRALRSGATYANVHTTKFPNGEIRGQVRAGEDDGGDASLRLQDTLCTGTLAGHHDNVVVPEGTACALVDATVSGNVDVKPWGAATIAGKTTIRGNVQSDGGLYVRVLGSMVTIGGNVQIKKAAEWSGYEAGTQILGNFQYEENSGTLLANGGVIHRNFQFSKNTGGGTISGNAIHQNLECKENVPGPVGGGNVVAGNKEGQCAEL